MWAVWWLWIASRDRNGPECSRKIKISQFRKLAITQSVGGIDVDMQHGDKEIASAGTSHLLRISEAVVNHVVKRCALSS